jgi:uncharacterized protein with HEPN domain
MPLLDQQRKLLEDMPAAAADIATFATAKSESDFVSDKQLRWSIERGFEIVGEALSQLNKIDPALAGQITDHRKIISFRNVLIHGYNHINPAITWDIVQNNLPILRRELEELLK